MPSGNIRLNEILDKNDMVISDDSDEEQTQTSAFGSIEGKEEDAGEESSHNPEFCIECSDMPIECFCAGCDEYYCDVCWQVLHRTGKRKNHQTTRAQAQSNNKENDTKANGFKGQNENSAGDNQVDQDNDNSETTSKSNLTPTESIIMEAIKKHIEFIPVRLTYEERKLLRLLEAALKVSEYTDKIDILSYKSKSKRIVAQLKEICSILAGLVVASDFKNGKELIENKEFVDYKDWYKDIFEIGRRYKIMNPEKMRDSFGKLCYMVMDSRFPEIRDHMEFDLYKPIKTVQSFINDKDSSGKVASMFSDVFILDATAEIRSEGLARFQIDSMIKSKERAIEKLCSKYSNKDVTKEDIRQILYSIGDFNSYVASNRTPIRRMLKRLESNFREVEEDKYNLGIKMGKNGARLSHTHETQYHFVHQSLTLWSIIMRDFIMLWSLADEDLLSKNNYRLMETGQGLQRVKSGPKVQRSMHKILNEVQRKTEVSFVGSSAVHLGDSAVPSALNYLDKYIQVPRILIPVDNCLSMIDKSLVLDPYIKRSIEEQFGSVSDLKKIILTDFFRHAFDGSGASDYFNAGSCIDGRLTSAWNWANVIAKKPYYKYFLLSGFVGFNGSYD